MVNTLIRDEWSDFVLDADLSHAAQVLHLHVLVWCNRNLNDGRIRRRVVSSIAVTHQVDDEAGALAELESAGLVVADGTEHWQFDWSKPGKQETRADVEKRRAGWSEAKEQQKRHKAGDHSLCKYCAAVKNSNMEGNKDSKLEGNKDSELDSNDSPSPSPSPSRSPSPKGLGDKGRTAPSDAARTTSAASAGAPASDSGSPVVAGNAGGSKDGGAGAPLGDDGVLGIEDFALKECDADDENDRGIIIDLVEDDEKYDQQCKIIGKLANIAQDNDFRFDTYDMSDVLFIEHVTEDQVVEWLRGALDS